MGRCFPFDLFHPLQPPLFFPFHFLFSPSEDKLPSFQTLPQSHAPWAFSSQSRGENSQQERKDRAEGFKDTQLCGPSPMASGYGGGTQAGILSHWGALRGRVTTCGKANTTERATTSAPSARVWLPLKHGFRSQFWGLQIAARSRFHCNLILIDLSTFFSFICS